MIGRQDEIERLLDQRELLDATELIANMGHCQWGYRNNRLLTCSQGYARIFNMSIEEWDAVINVHLRGAFCVNRPACTLMRAQKSGCIINFSSISAAGNSGQANYSAAKAGILGLTRTVARDMAKYGVRANAIWPAADTRMTATIPEAARQIRAERGVGAATPQPTTERRPESVAAVMFTVPPDPLELLLKASVPSAETMPLTVTPPEAEISRAPPPTQSSAALPSDVGLVKDPYVAPGRPFES